MSSPVYALFVYGSLRSGFHHPAFAYISQYFHFVADARVRGKLYDMGDFPAACPTTEDRWIIGELYHANSEDEFDWAISQLDDYEGLYPEAGEPAWYRRELTQVQRSSDGAMAQAWMYWFNGDVQGKPIVDSGDVLAYFQSKNK
ncbi:MAG: gamma-glutamylcyclotransferase [Bacteroidetes bacterium]|nr:gamma-glutamylcyclotransferase [Bacteroidota bacterium]